MATRVFRSLTTARRIGRGKMGIYTGKSGACGLSFALVRLALSNRIRIVGQAFLLAIAIHIPASGSACPTKGPKARSRPASDALALQVKEWAAANVWFPARPIRDIILRLHPPPAEESVAIERAASGQDASHRDAATTVLFLSLALGAHWFVCCRHL